MKQRCTVWLSNLPGECGDAAPDAEGRTRAGLLTSRALVPFPLLPTQFPTVVPLGERRFASDGFLTLYFVSCPFPVTWARASSGAVTLQGGNRAPSSQRLRPGPWLASVHPYLAVGSPSWCVGRAHSRVSRPQPGEAFPGQIQIYSLKLLTPLSLFHQMPTPSLTYSVCLKKISVGNLPFLHRPKLTRGVIPGLLLQVGAREGQAGWLRSQGSPRGVPLFPEIRPGLPALPPAASCFRSPFLSSKIVSFCTTSCYLNLRFFENGFLRGCSLLHRLSCGPRKSGGPVLMSRVPHSTALFCSELALLPKAEINQSWWRLSRNKSRPVQNWSLPSQNVIAWLSLRINQRPDIKPRCASGEQ